MRLLVLETILRLQVTISDVGECNGLLDCVVIRAVVVVVP